MAQLPQVGDKNWGIVLNEFFSTFSDANNGGLLIANNSSDLTSAPYNTLPDSTTVFVKGEKKLFKKETGTYVEKLNFSSTFSSTTPPSNPSVGDTYYNTVDDTIYYWDGSTWSIGSGSSSPTGSLQMFAGSTAPDGWLLCKGQEVSRTTYSALFSVISTTYGVGDGSTTFNLPNFQGKTAFGVSDSDSAFNLAVSGGSKAKSIAHTHTASFTSSTTGSHAHGSAFSTAAAGDHAHTYSANTSAPLGNAIDTITDDGSSQTDVAGDGHYHSVSGTTSTNGNHAHGIAGTTTATGDHSHSVSGTTASGGSATQDVLNPYVAVNYIIKT